jgi:hypothetical protein
MLPNAGKLEDILFPMTASVYYAVTSQTEYGNVNKRWIVDREVSCSAISEMSTRSFAGELKTKGTDFLYDSNVFFRTPEDIRKDSNGKYYPITAIAITGIKDPAGEAVWINGQNLSLEPGAVSTKYEIKTVVPTFDYNHELRHWRVYLTKTQHQRWDNR